jgi:hypothetical protein
MAENLDAFKCGGWGVFIASTTKMAVGEGCCRMAHQTVRCATGHCPVRHHVTQPLGFVKEKCALGPFLSILVIECQHKCLNVNSCLWMDKVQNKNKGMFLSLSTLVLCTNILV